jgi:hypothetical protein
MSTNYAVNEAGLFSLYLSEYLLAGYNPRMDDAIFPKKTVFQSIFHLLSRLEVVYLCSSRGEELLSNRASGCSRSMLTEHESGGSVDSRTELQPLAAP